MLIIFPLFKYDAAVDVAETKTGLGKDFQLRKFQTFVRNLLSELLDIRMHILAINRRIGGLGWCAGAYRREQPARG